LINKKKSLNILFLVIIYVFLSLIMFFTIRRNFVWGGDDVYYHLQRIQGLAYSFKHGDFMPGISTNYFGQIGYGINIFYPWITLVPFSLITMMVKNPINAYYIAIGAAFFVSFLISHYSMKEFSGSTKAAVAFSVIYNFSLYRLIDLMTRSAVAEYIATIFLPLCFLGFYEVFFGDERKWKSLAIGMSMIIMSHVLSTFICVVVLVITLLALIYKVSNYKKRIIAISKAVITTILATFIFTLPFISEELFQAFKQPSPGKLIGTSAANLIISSVNNSSARMYGGNTYNIGLLLIVFLFAGAFFYRRFTTKYRVSYILSVATFLMATSVFPWHLLQNTTFDVIQFPYRILMLTTFFVSVVAAEVINISLVNSSQKNVIGVISALSLIAYCSWYFSIQNVDQAESALTSKQFIVSRKMVDDHALPDTYLDQYSPKNSQQYLENIVKHESLINGKTKVVIPKLSGVGNSFTFSNIKKGTVIDLPVISYRYSNVILNGKKIVSHPSKRGTMYVTVPKNYQKLELKTTYGSKKISIIAQIVTYATWILIFADWIYKRVRRMQVLKELKKI